tara:strand:- start:342 stop:641 length:300 start_codon:yes stop_codon:yes gene_type:complete
MSFSFRHLQTINNAACVRFDGFVLCLWCSGLACVLTCATFDPATIDPLKWIVKYNQYAFVIGLLYGAENCTSDYFCLCKYPIAYFYYHCFAPVLLLFID